MSDKEKMAAMWWSSNSVRDSQGLSRSWLSAKWPLVAHSKTTCFLRRKTLRSSRSPPKKGGYAKIIPLVYLDLMARREGTMHDQVKDWIQAILTDEGHQKSLKVAAQGRAKFEGWLKFELVRECGLTRL
jgi:hypothetical protein